MPAQTRSRGRASTDVSYKSTAPAPQQQEFPHRRRQVKKTYGRPKPSRKLQQGTLTQMNFMAAAAQDDFVDPLDDEDKENIDEAEVIKPVETANPKKKNSRGNRRKTAGDELDVEEQPRRTKRRKTAGDAPSLSASSSFHTQTLTQFLSNKDEDEDVWQINDSEGDEDLGLVMETPRKDKGKQTSNDVDVGSSDHGNTASAVPSLVKSVTPSNRQKKTEIPSSQSPATPMLLRYSPAPHVSPLKTKSTNTAAPPPSIKKLQKIPRDFVVQDSYSTSHSSPITPTQKSTVKITPTKKIRFDLPENKENITPGRTKPKSPKLVTKPSGRQPLREVPDSDEDFDETGDEEDEEGVDELQRTPSKRRRDDVAVAETEPHPEVQPEPHLEPHPEPPETCYGAFGDETQAELISSEEQMSPEFDADIQVEAVPDDTVLTIPDEEETTRHAHDQDVTNTPASPMVEQTPASSPRDETFDENVSTTQSVDYTQGLESQRLPLEAIHALGPQTPRSDIMVSLHPEHIAKIVNGSKDHEFRAWKIPPDVSRVWVYTTKPVYELKYMCIFGPLKVPGEIQAEKGVGNKEFNQGKTVNKYAYEIIQVYELNNPVSLQEMKNKGWIAGAPQKYAFIPPAVVGELTANLRCALFEDRDMTESQELRARLQSDLDYSTQRHSSENIEEVIPSSQSPRKRTRKQGKTADDGDFVRPALPNMQSGSSIQGLPALPSQRPENFVRPSQATTVSQVSSSSPAVSPRKSIPVGLNSSSPPAYRHTHHSLRSSQFLTRSQMLPDSLLNDDIQEPPPIIWDSADEQSD